MHEMAIAQGIMEIVTATAKEHQAVKVTNVKVLAGQMRSIDQDSLTFALAALAKLETDIDFTEVNFSLEVVPFRAVCQNCRKTIEFEKASYRFFCPYCDSVQLDVISGKELRVAHIDIE